MLIIDNLTLIQLLYIDQNSRGYTMGKVVFVLFSVLITFQTYAQDCLERQTHNQLSKQTILAAWDLLTRDKPSGFGQRYAAELLISGKHYETPTGNTFFDFELLDLENAQFRYARLSSAHFKGANLRNANFAAAQLCDVQFKHANLSDAVFTEANLTRAKMFGVQFGESNFHQAILERTDLTDAKMKNVKNLTQAQVNTACIKTGASVELPAGFNHPLIVRAAE